MSPTSTSGGYHFRCPTGSEHISRHVETRRGKKILLQLKNFLLMRYKFDKMYLFLVICYLFNFKLLEEDKENAFKKGQEEK
jgi:hypothetical protein